MEPNDAGLTLVQPPDRSQAQRALAVEDFIDSAATADVGHEILGRQFIRMVLVGAMSMTCPQIVFEVFRQGPVHLVKDLRQPPAKVLSPGV